MGYFEGKRMVIIIQNDPEVPLGNYRKALDADRVPYRIVRSCDGEPLPEVGDVTAVIVLGGAMGANDDELYPFLADVKGFIGAVVAKQIPYLGICLGGQLLAAVTGGKVVSRESGEKGMLPVHLTEAGIQDPLFAGISEEFVTFQWHGDTFYPPPGAQLLAGSLACPRQAFRVGKHIYGLQFHPEVTREIVDCWARWTEETSSAVGQFVADFTARESDYLAVSRRILKNFLSLAQVPTRK